MHHKKTKINKYISRHKAVDLSQPKPHLLPSFLAARPIIVLPSLLIFSLVGCFLANLYIHMDT